MRRVWCVLTGVLFLSLAAGLAWAQTPVPGQQPTVTVELQGIELAEALRLLTRQAGYSFVVEGNLGRQPVTLLLREIEPAQALRIFLDAYGLEARKEGQVLIIRERASSRVGMIPRATSPQGQQTLEAASEEPTPSSYGPPSGSASPWNLPEAEMEGQVPFETYDYVPERPLAWYERDLSPSSEAFARLYASTPPILPLLESNGWSVGSIEGLHPLGADDPLGTSALGFQVQDMSMRGWPIIPGP